MLQTSAVIFGSIIIFVLVAGLIVLWRRGADDLDAWGLFVSRVLRGDRRPTRELPHSAPGRFARDQRSPAGPVTAAEPGPDGDTGDADESRQRDPAGSG
jgi:hypothetical protein